MPAKGLAVQKSQANRNSISFHCAPRTGLAVQKSQANRNGDGSPQPSCRGLGNVEKFEQAARGRDQNRVEKAICKLVVAGGSGAVVLEMAEHGLDPITLLVEDVVMNDGFGAVRNVGGDGGFARIVMYGTHSYAW